MPKDGKYDRQTAKFIATLIQNFPKIPSEEMQRLIDDPETIQENLERAFCLVDAHNFPVFRTIQIGTHSCVKSLRQDIEKSGQRISCNEILDRIKLASTPVTLNLVRLSVNDLGFEKGATTRNIYARARKLDLGLCPAEAGPQLRLQYKDQPEDETLFIAMKPIIKLDNKRFVVFCLQRYNSNFLSEKTSQLVEGLGGPDFFWGAHYEWVFVSN